VTNDPALRQSLDRIITVIGRAQETNGYLDTMIQLSKRPEGGMLTRQPAAWSGGLYREFQPDDFNPLRVQFIPYSVWQNRGRSEMSVWLTLAPGKQIACSVFK